MIRDCGDVIDRFSIAKLKSERIGNDENHKEYLAFTEEISKIKDKFSLVDWDKLCDMMVDINKSIWALEAAMKSGKELLPNPTYLDDPKNTPVLAVVGRNAILIRNINHLRVGLKNFINSTVKEGFQDVKQEHMSE